MPLPPSLYQAIEKLTESCNFSDIRKARRDLTQRYHTKQASAFITDDVERLSYLITRMPATYAVGHTVLKQLSKEADKITSLLDLGAGPGTLLWAAKDIFSSIKDVTLIEEDHRLAELGAGLFDDVLKKKQIHHIKSDLRQAAPFAPHTLVTLSYVLGELSSNHQKAIIAAAWEATIEFFVLMEPGTPQGFERIREARTQLIEMGAFIIAPCPHSLACPMAGKDWCHFSERLERTPLHRLIKEAPLAYEDEKYSYVIAAKSPLKHSLSRIIRKPQQGSGHFILDLCTQNGLKRVIISRKNQELYRIARHLEWGDPGPKPDGKNND
jgi:ribosomal protein RSM22 (predicted rRNA methylase)